jgi:hypothetical protein
MYYTAESPLVLLQDVLELKAHYYSLAQQVSKECGPDAARFNW